MISAIMSILLSSCDILQKGNRYVFNQNEPLMEGDSNETTIKAIAIGVFRCFLLLIICYFNNN